mmetsp:Transcript_21902/g.62169  ORF Transcript_21902/g.62169 Transcript_21902/m.62169 type:complete len:153 (+) Transcript_21902:260-718(+)
MTSNCARKASGLKTLRTESGKQGYASPRVPVRRQPMNMESATLLLALPCQLAGRLAKLGVLLPRRNEGGVMLAAEASFTRDGGDLRALIGIGVGIAPIVRSSRNPGAVDVGASVPRAAMAPAVARREGPLLGDGLTRICSGAVHIVAVRPSS